jgi:hypothetical protein
MLPRELLVAAAPNTVTFEAYPELQRRVFDLLSLSTAQTDTSDKLASLLCCLPEAAVPQNLGYEHTFRVVISQFLDRFNFDLGTVKRSASTSSSRTGGSSRSTPTTPSIAPARRGMER